VAEAAGEVDASVEPAGGGIDEVDAVVNPAHGGIDEVDAVVVGAGVVGLAVARALALAGLEVVLLEAEGGIGTGTSSRNSEVIHAGLYYPAGSLKARLCVRGRELLYGFCATHGVDTRRCGKLIVAATSADLPELDAIRAHAEACGVTTLQPLTRDQVAAIEPEVQCAAALLSPETGIVDSHGLMTALLGDAEIHGAALALATRFEAAWRDGDGWQVMTAPRAEPARPARRGGSSGPAEPDRLASRSAGEATFVLRCRWLVNCAGLQAQAVARRMHGFPQAAVPPRHLAKGHYFSLAGRSPFSRLIYPTPVEGGLGTHLTLDLGGQARFGPDVLWLPPLPDNALLDYAVDPARGAAFEADIRRWWPRLPAGALQPAYSGIRPKLSGPGEPAADFRIDGPATHGCPGTVQLFGIESPGLTASLAIADLVATLLK